MAKTFNYGAGIWATKTGSSMAYNDQNDNYKPLPFSVTRDSIATRVNKQGLIEVVGQDKLRIDYTDSTKGVALLEPARTNLVLQSEDFNTTWFNSGTADGTTTTITSNSTIAPDGTQTADLIAMTRPNTAVGTYIAQQQSTGAGVHIGSIYLKAKNAANVGKQIQLWQWQSGERNMVTVTLTENWKRYNTASDYSLPSGTNELLGFGFRGLIGTDTDVEFYAWGAQGELGNYPTSYIPTSGSAVPRAADVANGAGNSEVFNDSEGVLFADIAAIDDADTNNRRLGLTKNNTFEGLRIQYSGSTIGAVLYDGSTNQYSQTFTFDKLSLFAKVAFKYKASDFALWINGFEYGAQASGTTLSEGTLDDLSFDYVNGNFFLAKTKEIGVYDAVLTDAELEALTSYTSFTNMANELNLTIK